VAITQRIRPLRAIAAAANHERLLWAVRVRWLAIGGFSILAVLAWRVGVLPALQHCAVAALASGAINAINHWCIARWRYVRAVTALAIAADVLLITYLILHTGGTHSPFIMLYVVQVVATAMLVDLVVAAAGALASVLCFLLALWLQSPDALATAALPPRGGAYQMIWGLFLLYCLALLTLLGGYIAERLRRSEDDLAERNRHLRRALESLEHAHADLQRVVERLRTTESQLVQSEKLRAIGQFVAGIAHELNNPIGFVTANLEHLRHAVGALEQMLAAYARAPVAAGVESELTTRRHHLRIDELLDDLPSVLQDCEDGARRAAEIVGALRTFGSSDRLGAWSRVDLRDRLERTLALLRHRVTAGVTIERDYAELPLVECIPGQLDQVWLNILTNAIDAVGGRGTIAVRTRLGEPCSARPQLGAHAVVSVRDDGGGMDPEVCARVFDPFFTTKPEGKGMGLGLSVSYGVVERHGGAIAVESAAGRGTTFTVCLPLEHTAPAAPASGPTPAPAEEVGA
jgi:signal transduction histidine kinase